MNMQKIFEYFNRFRVILDRESSEPYLERYYLLLKDRNVFPFNVFLHKFLKSDPDGALHDHPWNYITIILRGGYWEIVPTIKNGRIARKNNGEMVTNKIWRGAGHMRRCDAFSFHRIELEKGTNAWKLFIPGIRKRDWGFDVNGAWIPEKVYLDSRMAK